MPGGRPSKYSEELAEVLCDRIAAGESLRKICGGAGVPTRRTVERWLEKDDEFRRRYARAREQQQDHFADQIIEIADGADVESSVAIQKARLRIDARKWLMSKLAPKKYGSRVELSETEDMNIVIKHWYGPDEEPVEVDRYAAP